MTHSLLFWLDDCFHYFSDDNRECGCDDD